MKLSYEALQQRQEEEELTASSSTPPRETGRAMSEWLRESQEATKELLKLKDRLIEVERNVSGFPRVFNVTSLLLLLKDISDCICCC